MKKRKCMQNRFWISDFFKSKHGMGWHPVVKFIPGSYERFLSHCHSQWDSCVSSSLYEMLFSHSVAREGAGNGLGRYVGPASVFALNTGLRERRRLLCPKTNSLQGKMSAKIHISKTLRTIMNQFHSILNEASKFKKCERSE